LLIGSIVFAPILLFYVCCFVALTLFCALARNDFIGIKKPKFPGWFPHLIGVMFAVLFASAVLLISNTSAPWQMMIGTPTIVVWSFSFLIALAFIFTAILQLVSPVFARVGWVLMIIVLLFTPLNHEPLRILPAWKDQARLTPSAHFIEWLAKQKGCEIVEGHLMSDHVHMCISIPQKQAVSNVVGFLKGKSAISIARQFMGKTKNFTGENFWARGYLYRQLALMKKLLKPI